MYKMSATIDINLGVLMSRKACAVIIRYIIKFIAYNTQQIPYTYEGLQRLVYKKRKSTEHNGEMSGCNPRSFKQMKAKKFYEEIEALHDAFEIIFKCIEDELVGGRNLREIAVVLGATLVSPKHIYRILIPKLTSNDDCETKIRSFLLKIHRCFLSSNDNCNFTQKPSGLMNTYVLMNGECISSVESGCFIPKFDFRIPPRASQTYISFIDDATEDCNLRTDDSSSPLITIEKNREGMEIDEVSNLGKWFLAKHALRGFHDMKIDGVSLYNVAV